MQTSGTYNTSSLQDDLLFKYEYDKKKRLIKKKVPGVAEEYLFYDKKGRLVLTQDGILRQADKWRFIKYNTQGQIILTGIYFDDQRDEFAEMQSYIDGFVDNQSTFFYEYYTGIDQSNFHGYSNQSFPTLDANDRILSIKYYSDYAFDVNSEYEFSDFANDLPPLALL
ncbi:MAG: hypothetical protein U5Q03_17935 [Bacteroidota bacterium]|nr:hypothetical protein [Bacteroidota bacterium]